MSHGLDDLDCKTASRMISDGQDRLMPQTDRERLHSHFVICADCRNTDAQMQFLRRAMRRMGKDEDAPPP